MNHDFFELQKFIDKALEIADRHGLMSVSIALDKARIDGLEECAGYLPNSGAVSAKIH